MQKMRRMGSSIVCAWVSAVTQMALIGLEQQIQTSAGVYHG
jgi:uncharacterized protein YsxB (DUF464 family)